MVIWFIVGLSIVCVWIWSLLFLFSVSKGEHTVGEHEQKLSSKSKVNTQNVNDSINEIKKGAPLVPHC